MNKRIALCTIEKKASDLYAKQLNHFFSGKVSICCYNVSELKHREMTAADIYLVSVPDVINSFEGVLPKGADIIYIERTFFTNKTHYIRSLEKGTTVLVLGYSDVFVNEMLSALNSIHCENVNFISSYDPGVELSRRDIRVAISASDEIEIPEFIDQVIDIGYYQISPTTYLEILKQLNLMDSTMVEKVYTYSKQVHIVNPGILEMIQNAWVVENKQGAILEMIDDGAVLLDEKDRILHFNAVATELVFDSVILDQKRISAKECFLPEIYSLYVQSEAFSSVLKELDGRSLLISKRPVKIHLETKGYVLLIKDTSEIQAAEQKLRIQQAKKGAQAKYTFESIVTCSPKMLDYIEISKKIADNHFSVLITGDSGVGKELCAQSIHNASPRSKMPFIAVNCAALPEELLESELFGYEEGAFTGAKVGGKKGLLEIAHKGSVFFDEIGEMPLSIQAKLLRALQEREVRRIGGDTIIPIDIRIIAATNVDLKELADKRQFRKDLYYRLNVMPIHIPALREHPEDIPLLAGNFLKEYGDQEITNELSVYLRKLPWHGNIRELKNCVAYMSMLGERELSIKDLPPDYQPSSVQTGSGEPSLCTRPDLAELLPDEQIIAEAIIKILQIRSAGRRRLKELLDNQGIEASEYKIRNVIKLLESKKVLSIHPGKRGITLIERDE